MKTQIRTPNLYNSLPDLLLPVRAACLSKSVRMFVLGGLATHHTSVVADEGSLESYKG